MPFLPIGRQASLASTTREAIAAQLAIHEGVVQIRVNARLNIAAADLSPESDPAPLLAITTLCDIPVRARIAGAEECAGVIFAVDTSLTVEDILGALESSVVVLGRSRRGADVVLRFAGKQPPSEISLLKLRRPVRPRLPRPMQCRRCGVFTHATAARNRTERCLRCGGAHRATNCEAPAPRCTNCGGHHAATEPRCPRWQEERQVAILGPYYGAVYN